MDHPYLLNKSSVVVDSFLIFATIVCDVFVFEPCFVGQYLVSFLVLQPSHWRRENWKLYFTCLLVYSV